MLMGPQHGRVEHHPVEFRGLQRLKNGFPHFFLGQPAEAAADGIGLAEPLVQVGPRRPRAQEPHHGVEKQPVITGRHATVGCFARQKRRDQGPLMVGDFVTMHWRLLIYRKVIVLTL